MTRIRAALASALFAVVLTLPTVSKAEGFAPRSTWNSNLTCAGYTRDQMALFASTTIVFGNFDAKNGADVACYRPNGDVYVATSSQSHTFGSYSYWGSLPAHMARVNIDSYGGDDIAAYDFLPTLQPVIHWATANSTATASPLRSRPERARRHRP